MAYKPGTEPQGRRGRPDWLSSIWGAIKGKGTKSYGMKARMAGSKPKTYAKPKTKTVAPTKAKGGDRLKGAHKGPSPKPKRVEQSKKYKANGGVTGTKPKQTDSAGYTGSPGRKNRNPDISGGNPKMVKPKPKPKPKKTIVRAAVKKKKGSGDKDWYNKAVRRGFGRI